MFKRDDSAPIISEHDKAFFELYKDKNVLLFDEDVAKGKTLKIFSEALKVYFNNCYTGCALRHYLSPFCPNFVGKEFYDF